jgi:Holliday junction resolvase RusA-like endonuclease
VIAPRTIDGALCLTIPGDPVAQGRGRAVRMGAGVRVIDPARSRSWKGLASMIYQQAVGAGIAFPEGPLYVAVDAYFKRPARLKLPGQAWRPSRPDADNLAKGCMDAGNGILWTDDAQIVLLIVRKWYAANGDAPRVEVVVRAAKEV